MALHINISDYISFSALLLALYSTKKTIDFNKRQNELNQLLVDKEQQESFLQKQADISANLINIGRNYRVKVFNKGKATASNVRIEFPNGNEILVENDVERKFPTPRMEPQQSVELIAAVHMGSPSRMDIKLIWDDPSGNDRNKIVTITI